ncbi:MAG: DUF1080 domain-containing protein [Pyrinomonadaceae bacterium]
MGDAGWRSRARARGAATAASYLQNRYEVQILDSYNNKTYVNGQAGSVYKQYPPLVNASRKPGEWQAYDIIFRAPTFDDQGNVTKRAHITVMHNGVLVQDHVEVMGTTSHDQAPSMKSTRRSSRFRCKTTETLCASSNIWVRTL